jgi:mRNA interferase RelE/StbE
MSDYKIELTPAARRNLKKIPEQHKQKIWNSIVQLSIEPRPHGYTELTDFEIPGFKTRLYRIRIGDYRVIYAIENEIITVTVVSIKHRREVYK